MKRGARARWAISALAFLGFAGVFPWVTQDASGAPMALLFDASTKEMKGPAGATNFTFTFALTNAAAGPVTIESVRTSCGCTVAKVPTLPWTLASGERGEFSVVLDARGKRGTVTKSVFVNTSVGVQSLSVRAIIEAAAESDSAAPAIDDRLRNMQIALADRFAVFRGECASCHATPADGKHGPALYTAVCAVCHDSHNRASMVPDLKNLGHATDREHWVRWITFGRHGSLMPAFAQSEGGPLTDEQVDSLADFLSKTLDRRNSAGRSGGPAREYRLPPLPGGAPGVP
ncbi:MAG: DUF1573 domain-containing protein [Verrucomicrobiales bacterium]|nr:DUF1573 domain-containing protein [Verrucomicrobiales bacterium]